MSHPNKEMALFVFDVTSNYLFDFGGFVLEDDDNLMNENSAILDTSTTFSSIHLNGGPYEKVSSCEECVGKLYSPSSRYFKNSRSETYSHDGITEKMNNKTIKNKQSSHLSPIVKMTRLSLKDVSTIFKVDKRTEQILNLPHNLCHNDRVSHVKIQTGTEPSSDKKVKVSSEYKSSASLKNKESSYSRNVKCASDTTSTAFASPPGNLVLETSIPSLSPLKPPCTPDPPMHNISSTLPKKKCVFPVKRTKAKPSPLVEDGPPLSHKVSSISSKSSKSGGLPINNNIHVQNLNLEQQVTSVKKRIAHNSSQALSHHLTPFKAMEGSSHFCKEDVMASSSPNSFSGKKQNPSSMKLGTASHSSSPARHPVAANDWDKVSHSLDKEFFPPSFCDIYPSETSGRGRTIECSEKQNAVNRQDSPNSNSLVKRNPFIPVSNKYHLPGNRNESLDSTGKDRVFSKGVNTSQCHGNTSEARARLNSSLAGDAIRDPSLSNSPNSKVDAQYVMNLLEIMINNKAYFGYVGEALNLLVLEAKFHAVNSSSLFTFLEDPTNLSVLKACRNTLFSLKKETIPPTQISQIQSSLQAVHKLLMLIKKYFYSGKPFDIPKLASATLHLSNIKITKYLQKFILYKGYRKLEEKEFTSLFQKVVNYQMKMSLEGKLPSKDAKVGSNKEGHSSKRLPLPNEPPMSLQLSDDNNRNNSHHLNNLKREDLEKCVENFSSLDREAQRAIEEYIRIIGRREPQYAAHLWKKITYA